MPTAVYSYTIYHSPNAYLGTVLLRRALAGLSGVELVRQPIFVPRERGVLVSELLGGKENANAGSYNREDCARWSKRHSIPLAYPGPNVFRERAQRWSRSRFDREELPARAFYAADADARDRLDQALFDAAWVGGLDVNEPETIRRAAASAGLAADALLAAAEQDEPAARARAALDAFDRLACPGVPTVVVGGERFFGKDRVDWVIDACRRLAPIGAEIS